MGGSSGKERRRTASPRLVIESVEDHRSPLYNDAIRLYRQVFPTSERTDPRFFGQVLQEKRMGLLWPFNFHFLVARTGHRVAGMTTGHYLAIVNMGFVGYLAVLPSIKGKNIGSRLRRRLIEEMRRDARAAGHKDLTAVMGEVEAGNRWLRYLIKNRGAFAFDFDYRQPPLRSGLPDVPLVMYLEPVGRPVRKMRAEDLRQILYAIYRRMYRVKYPLRNLTFRRMLKSLEGRRWIGRRRL